MSNRCFEPGWILVGNRDPVERRGVWVKEICNEKNETISIEVCYGREGDDFHFVVNKDNPLFKEFASLFNFVNWIDEQAMYDQFKKDWIEIVNWVDNKEEIDQTRKNKTNCWETKQALAYLFKG